MSSFLSSEEGLMLTRASISHFEAMFETEQISKMRLISPEMLSALSTQCPNSTKVHSTIRHQCPLFYQELMTVIDAIKSERDDQSSAVVAQNVQNTQIIVQMID
eukprot:3543335-Amphidinium_carterae.1